MWIQTWRHCQIEIFLRLGFLDVNLAFFQQENSRYRDRRDFFTFIVNAFFPFGANFLYIILLNILFLMTWIKNIKIHCRCVQRSCLPWELMWIRHPAWKPKSQFLCVPWYLRYISTPSSSFSVRWNLTVAYFLLQVFLVNNKNLLYKLFDHLQSQRYDKCHSNSFLSVPSCQCDQKRHQ